MKPRYVKLWADLWGRINNPMAYLLFLYLLQRAEVKDNKVAKRGQILTSIDALSKCLHMSKTSVRRNLQKLATGGLVGTLSGAPGTVVTICDYDSYNGVPDEAAQSADPSEEKRGFYVEVTSDLDSLLGTSFATQNVEEWFDFVNARRREGNTLEDFKMVHRRMIELWRGTPMEEYLTPGTLYRPTKFPKYKNLALAKERQRKSGSGVEDLL